MRTENGLSFEKKHLIHAAWGTWEPLAFYKRNGYGESFENTPEWIDLWFDRINSEDAIRRLADAGITLVIGRYFKGFGLEAEAPDLAYAREQMKWCKKYGITYLGYVQALTLVSDTFFKEVPEARSWIRLGPDGEMKHYEYTESWRKEPAIYHDGFIDYLKHVFTQCVEVDGADGVMLDNLGAHPCYCENCQSKFAEYVRSSETFSPEALSLAHLDYEEIRIPRVLKEYDPLAYEYFRFRLGYQTRVLETLHKHMKSIRPDAIFCPNGSSAVVTHENRPSLQEVYHPGIEEHFDALKNDGSGAPTYSDGRIRGSIKRYKLATALRTIIIPKNPLGGYQPDVVSDAEASQLLTRCVAEQMAFGGMPMGFMGVLNPTRTDRGRKLNIDYPVVFDTVSRYSAFVRDNGAVYEGAKSAAQVRLYHSARDLQLRPQLMRGVAQQGCEMLLKNHVAFTCVTADLVDGMDAEFLLILQDVLAMTPEECAEIVRFYERGGKIIILGPTSWYNERAREVARIGLHALVSEADEAKWDAGELIRADRLFIEPSPSADLNQSLRLGRRHFCADRRESLDISSLIDASLPRGLQVTCDAPEYVLMDAYQTASGQLAVHLFNLRNDTPHEDLAVTVSSPEYGSVRHLTPDYDSPQATVTAKNGKTRVGLDCVRTYSIVLFEK